VVRRVLRLPLTASGPVNVARRKTGIRGGELHIDRRQFSGLSRPAKYGATSKALILLFSGTPANLERSPPHR
jgi:hypothetical protein